MAISNERAPIGYHGTKPLPQPFKPPEDNLSTEKVEVENKMFTIQLRENRSGRFIRIIEERSRETNGRRDIICVPLVGIEAFKAALETVSKA